MGSERQADMFWILRFQAICLDNIALKRSDSWQNALTSGNTTPVLASHGHGRKV